MNTLRSLLPILAAIISATALLAGYAWQRKLEQDAEIDRKRQEIYSLLITNITERNTIVGRLLDQSPEYIKAKPEERQKVEQELWAAGRLTNAELSKNEGARTEVSASLCLYGTDEAIDAYAEYIKANIEGKEGGDLGKLIMHLRHSIYKKTHITADEAKLAIWQDPRYLEKSSAAK